MKKPVQFNLNGVSKAIFVNGGESLLTALRQGVGDTSPKYGCGQGTCGTCTVLIDGKSHVSCLVLAESVEGKTINTTGGLANGPELHPLQEAFMENFAAQCGYCTSGMLMSAKSLLDQNPNPTRDDVIEAISGNICRCTGYEPIVDAILGAAQKLRGGSYGGRVA